jgi:hypothetical protein
MRLTGDLGDFFRKIACEPTSWTCVAFRAPMMCG